MIFIKKKNKNIKDNSNVKLIYDSNCGFASKIRFTNTLRIFDEEYKIIYKEGKNNDSIHETIILNLKMIK